MATNWTLSQALEKITEGKDKAAIQDIGRRFPLATVALAEIGQNAGATKIIGAVPAFVTVRKIEAVLKDGVVDQDDEEIEEDAADETPKKQEKRPAKPKAKVEEDDDQDDEEDDPVALYKKCKKMGLKVAPKKTAKYYKDQIAKAEAESEDDADDDWDDEEEEKPAPKKKAAVEKKAPAKKPAKKAEPEDDEEEEDDWDI